MTYKEWGKVIGAKDPRYENMVVELYADWTADRDELLAKLKEYEAFNEPLKRVYENIDDDRTTSNTAEEATP